MQTFARITAALGAAAGLGLALGLGSAPAFGQGIDFEAPAPLAEPGFDASAVQQDQTFYGRLLANPGNQCSNQGSVRVAPCDGNPEPITVRAIGINAAAYYGKFVAIQGVMRECAADAEFIDAYSIEETNQCGPDSPAPSVGNLLAQGEIEAVSLQEDAHPAEHAIDGDLLTYWSVPAGVDSAWVIFELGAVIDVDQDGQPDGSAFSRMRLSFTDRYAEQYGLYVWSSTEGDWLKVFQKNAGTVDETVTFPRATGHWVLLQLARSAEPGAGYGLREFELYRDEKTNFARGATMRASSFMAGRSPWEAVDGRTESYWQSEPGERHPNIRALFSRRAELTSFELLWHPAATPAVFRVGFYEDNQIKRWTDYLYSRSNRQSLSWGEPIPTDGFAIWVDQLGQVNDFVALHEMELYGVEEGGGLSLDLGLGLENGILSGLSFEDAHSR